MARLADDIYNWRVLNHMTQADAASWANVSLTTWSRWERGITEPDEENYLNLQWLIGTPIGMSDEEADALGYRRSEVRDARSAP